MEQSLVGLGATPTDLKATGNSAPGVPSPPASSGAPGGVAPRVHTNRQASPPAFDPTGGKSRTEIAGELVSGAASGVGQAAATALSVDLLRVPAGLLHVAGSAWASGDPVAGLGALFWEPGAAQVDDLVASAVDGDFKGAAEAGVKAITIGVATGVALGELGGAAAEAGKEVWNDRGGVDFGKSSALYPAGPGQKMSSTSHTQVPEVSTFRPQTRRQASIEHHRDTHGTISMTTILGPVEALCSSWRHRRIRRTRPMRVA